MCWETTVGYINDLDQRASMSPLIVLILYHIHFVQKMEIKFGILRIWLEQARPQKVLLYFLEYKSSEFWVCFNVERCSAMAVAVTHYNNPGQSCYINTSTHLFFLHGIFKIDLYIILWVIKWGRVLKATINENIQILNDKIIISLYVGGFLNSLNLKHSFVF